MGRVDPRAHIGDRHSRWAGGSELCDHWVGEEQRTQSFLDEAGFLGWHSRTMEPPKSRTLTAETQVGPPAAWHLWQGARGAGRKGSGQQEGHRAAGPTAPWQDQEPD